MFSPFEELEYLADYLPEEGETVLISREAGELVCQPWLQEDFRDGIDDSRLYGRLVQANERLHNAGAMPIWVTLMGLVWLAILLHGAIGLGWSHWYVVPGLGLPALFGCFHWIRFRQHQLFRRSVLPGLQDEMARRRLPLFTLIAGVRQHAELRTLLDELVRCSPSPEE
jgi:hypothetical protein